MQEVQMKSAKIGEEGRGVTIMRSADGSIMIDWVKPDEGNGLAYISTKVRLTEEAAYITTQLLIDVLQGE